MSIKSMKTQMAFDAIQIQRFDEERRKLTELAEQFDKWADANDEICEAQVRSGGKPAWQASGYMKAYRRAAAEIRKILDET